MTLLLALLACTPDADTSKTDSTMADTGASPSDDTALSGDDTSTPTTTGIELLDDCTEYAGGPDLRCASDGVTILRCDLVEGAYKWVADSACDGDAGDPWEASVCWEFYGEVPDTDLEGWLAACGCPDIGEQICVDEDEIYTCEVPDGSGYDWLPLWSRGDSEQERRAFRGQSEEDHDDGSIDLSTATRDWMDSHMSCACAEDGSVNCSCDPGATTCQDAEGSAECGRWTCDESGEFFYSEEDDRGCDCG